MKNILTVVLASCVCGGAFAASAAVSPRIILDSDRLEHGQGLNSGWEKAGADFVRPFNRQTAGIVRSAGVFALPADVTAELRFETAKGAALKVEKLVGGNPQSVHCEFAQDGSLARVRLVPSKPIAAKGVIAKPFRVTVDWAVDENFTCVSGGPTSVSAVTDTQERVPPGWRGQGARVVDLPYLACGARDGTKRFDKPAADAVLEIAPGGWIDPCADPALLTDAYAFEFDALVAADTDASFAGVRLRDLYKYTPDVWYHFRFEVKGKKAKVRLNGRIITEGEVKVKGQGERRNGSSDSANCTIRNLSSTAKLLVDDVKAFALVTPADYPSAPVRAKGEEKWDVIMNVCSLWYNGFHGGWRCVERFAEARPVLGYYDEGLPETADWEIRYMVEHGVDVQAFCWYPESHDGPIRHPRNEFHLRDGFKNARYSDRMKYCLIWEIQNAGRPHSLEAWKKNYVPYLIEHHFKDPRYYAPDGKPLLAVFGARNFPDPTAFGSPEKTKEAFAYLEGELKKLGFKGLVTVSSHCGRSGRDFAACGFTAQCPYNYGTEGWKTETQKTRNLERAAEPGLFSIPAVSVGFNSRPWHGEAFPMMSPADLKASLKWVRDEYMPRQKYAEPWQAKSVLLSTWNEYGEGTYLMPTDDERGFGYLDAVRAVFTDEAPDPKLNVKPTQAQRARLCHLYPQKLAPDAQAASAARLCARTCVKGATLVGKKFHPGTRFTYSAWAPAGLRENAAVYVLIEHGPSVGLDDALEKMMADGSIPPGIVVFWLGAGTLPATLPGGADRGMRASELDQPGTEFPSFLAEELVPAAAAKLGVTVNPSPDFHFVTGGSSGGIAAWNAAWFRNDYFRRAFLSSPTFSAMRGGEELMPIVRKCETRPIKVFMTVGTIEPDYFFGDSFLVAMNAASVFKYAGYDYRFEVYEHEGHCARRGDPALWNRMMPWLFEGWKTNLAVVAKGNPPRVRMLLAPGSKWERCDFRMPAPVREVRSTDGWRVYSVAPESRFVTAESVLPDGTRAQRYVLSNLHVAWNARRVGGAALAHLEDDRVLVATDLGIQGVVSFGLTDLVLPLPGDLPADNVAVVGKTLYAASGDCVFKRELKLSAADPAKKSAPRTPGYGDGPYSHEHLPIPANSGTEPSRRASIPTLKTF